MHHQAKNKNVLKTGEDSLLKDDELKSLMLHFKEIVDRGCSVTPKDIIDEAHKILRSRLGDSIRKPDCTWFRKFLKKHQLNTVIDEHSRAIIPPDDIIAWFSRENIMFDLDELQEFSEDRQESFTFASEEDLRNHKSKCRLCIEDVEENSRIEISEDVRSLILKLQIKLILTRSYSNFICENCHENLQQLSSFRRRVNEKQQKLSQFLCKIKHENSGQDETFKIDSFINPVNLETVVVKIEPLDESLEQKMLATTECAFCNKHFESSDLHQIHLKLEHKTEELNEDTNFDNNFEFSNEVMGSESQRSISETTETTEIQPPTLSVKKKISRLKEMPLLTCSVCGKVFRYQQSLFKHIKEHSKSKCKKTRELCLQTLSEHSKDKRKKTKELYFCDLCGKELHKKTTMELHIINHIPKEHQKHTVKCEFCPRYFLHEMHKNRHIEHVHKEENSQCECGKVFRNKKRLLSHIRTTHEKEKLFKTCEMCGKVFINTTELKRHFKVHHTEGGKGNFPCPDCGKVFDESWRMNRHRKRHQEKTFCCDVCGASFIRHYEMKTHKDRVHLRIRNFNCDVENCGKAFPDRKNLKRHVRSVHQKHKLNCPVDNCNFMVGRRLYMKTHLMKHKELNQEELQEFLDIVKKMDLF